MNNPSTTYLEVLTSNKMVVGDPRYSDRDTFVDISNIFLTNINGTHLNLILTKHNISAILIDMTIYPDSKNTILENINLKYEIRSFNNYILIKMLGERKNV